MRRFQPDENEKNDQNGQVNQGQVKVEEVDRQNSQQNQINMGVFEALFRQYLQTSNFAPNFNEPFVNNTMNENSSCAPYCSVPHPGPNHSCSETMIDSLFQIVSTQTKSLETLSHKVQQITHKNKELNAKVKQLEQENSHLKQHNSIEKQTKDSFMESKSEIKVDGEQVDKQSLLEMLFGRKQYSYHLRLMENLEMPLYRERNFNLRIELVDSEGNKVGNGNKVPMSLALYTCENPPKFIEKNTTGQKMIKGYVDQSLLHGECTFEKIQIREVTSHYRNSWLFLVGIPCMTPLGTHKTDSFIDFKEIKPLVIEEIVVKAKKPKKQQKTLTKNQELEEEGMDDKDEN